MDHRSLFMKHYMKKIVSFLHLGLLRKYLTFFLIFSVFLYLVLNIALSQFISSLYFKTVDQDRFSVVLFLRGLINNPVFPTQFSRYQNIYGKDLKNEVYAKQTALNLKIKNLEQILKLNPRARDILYSLYWLYLEKGDKTKAEEYLNRASKVDPKIMQKF